MNDINGIEIIKEHYLDLLRDVNLPKSPGKLDAFACKGLVFYLSDLHIETYINLEEDIEKQISKLVDKVIKNSLELYAIIKANSIKTETSRWRSLQARIKNTDHDIEVLKECESLNNEEKKHMRALIKEKKALCQELDSFGEEYKNLEAKTFKGVSEKNRLFAEQHHSFYIILAGDISNSSERAKIFYHRLRKWIPDEPILAVLGNHELSQFNSVQDAIVAYQEIFNEENIILLRNNGVTTLNYPDVKDEWIAEHGVIDWPGHKYRFDNLCFFGGVGFNKYDKYHNADTIITSHDLQNNIEKEIEECNKFVDSYSRALEYAHVYDKVLVVISHYPVRDWMRESECDNACYYFYGHNHKNESFISNGAYIFADNQVGYNSKMIAFKQVELLGLYNPFFTFEDGIHTIDPIEYVSFYKFAGEGSIGTYGRCRRIEKYLDKGYDLTMIKKNGFYGFFLVKGDRVCICKGANVTELHDGYRGIDYYYDSFDKMVKKYLELLTPFKRFQKELSEEIKKIGGCGTMHGLIVDYDQYHHIMISPTENKLFFYWAPTYGTATNLFNVRGLLSHVGVDEITKKDWLINMKPDSILLINGLDDEKEYGEESQLIDIKNSPYAVSIKMRNLERICTAGILRDWNDDLIEDFLTQHDEKLLK